MTGRRYTLEGVTVNGQFVAGDIRGDLHLNQSGTQDRPVAQRRDDFEDAAVRLGFGCDVVGFSGRSGSRTTMDPSTTTRHDRAGDSGRRCRTSRGAHPDFR